MVAVSKERGRAPIAWRQSQFTLRLTKPCPFRLAAYRN